MDLAAHDAENEAYLAEKITWTNERRTLADLKPWERNPRQISREQAKRLAESFDTFGQVETIAVGPDNQVYNGHQRLSVLLDKHGSGYEVEVRVSSRALTEKEREKLTVYLHKGAAGEWNFDALSEWDVPDLVEWGFEPEELGITVDEPTADEPDEIAPDRFGAITEKWQTAAGQLWRLGNHKILCGDSLDPENISRLIGNETPTLILADPPYGVNIVAANGYVGGGEAYDIPFGGRKKGYVGGGNSIKDKTGHYPIENWKKPVTGSVGASKPFGSKADRAVRGTVGASHIVEVGKYPVIIGDEDTETAVKAVTIYREKYPDAVHVWWGANYYSPSLTASMCWLVWYKETTGNFADCELAWTNQKRAARLFQHKWNGMLRDSEHERRWHPTQKPAALAAWVYGLFTLENEVIIDPFAGAGWSILAGEQTGRKVYAIEKAPEYVAVILERWVDMTGGVPELL